MKTCLVAACIVAAMTFIANAAEKRVEIGYVESFDGKADAFVIHRAGGDVHPALLAPIYNDDAIEVATAGATIRLKLTGRPGQVIISQANHNAKLAAEPPKTSMFSPLLEWASRSINIFDTEERELVAANIRGSSGELSAPALARPQALFAGRQSFVVGWLGPRQASIRLTDARGGEIASGRAAGGLWTSQPINLTSGRYTVVVSDGQRSIQQTVDVRPTAEAPTWRADPATAPELNDISVAAWLAGSDDRFMLAALQKIAPHARDSQPARVLTKALVSGRRPQGKPPGA